MTLSVSDGSWSYRDLTVSQLIKDVMRERGWSYRDLQREADQRGHAMPHARWQQLVERPVRRPPEDKALRTISAVCDVDLETVRQCVLRSMGWAVHQPCPLTDRCVVVVADQLTPGELEQVCGAVEHVVASIKQERERDHTVTQG